MIFVVEEIRTSDVLFIRDNDDLRYDIFISLKEALLGFNKEIKHLDNHIVYLNRTTVTQPGHVIKIKGEGMPKHQKSEKGDLYVKVNVLIPNILTEKQKEIAKTLFENRSYW